MAITTGSLIHFKNGMVVPKKRLRINYEDIYTAVLNN